MTTIKMLSIIKLLTRPNSIKIIRTHLLNRNFCFLTFNCKLQAIISPSTQYNFQTLRFKSKGKSKKSQEQQQSGSESDEDHVDKWDEQVTDKTTKVAFIKVNSLRIDGLLKSSLGIARNKVETLFYQSKIRLNGDKVLKKGAFAQEGDEIDIIKGPDPKNPDFLVVARVEILSVSGNEDNLKVKIRKCKSLVIENYEEKWQPTT